jgi:hypothetical protein
MKKLFDLLSAKKPKSVFETFWNFKMKRKKKETTDGLDNRVAFLNKYIIKLIQIINLSA